jgi:DNA polymerase III epsilon subunit-like protein
MSIIFLDTETTALLAVDAADIIKQPHIVEIYLEKTTLDLEPISSMHLVIKPPISIPPEVTKIHGIDNALVKNKNPFAAHYKDLATYFLDVSHMVGHNLQYDKRMLIYELQRINKQYQFPWPIRDICTVEEILKIKGHRMTLQSLHEELFGGQFPNAHRAEGDVKALIRIYKEMIRRNIVKEPTI